MGLARFPYSKYDGGLNLRDGPFNLEPNEAQRAKNVSLSQRGTIIQRNGLLRYDTSGFPAGKTAQHIQQANFETSHLLMLSIDGDVYSMAPSGILTRRYDGTPGTVWDFESAQDSAGNYLVWMMNGVDPPQKWDGLAAGTSAWAGDVPNGTMLRVWKNQMCVSGVILHPQRLYHSAIANPESPTGATDGGWADRWIDIKTTEDDLDPITWIDICEDYLLVLKRRSLWSVYDGTTFANQRLGDPGVEGRFQSGEVLGRCYFVNPTGVYSSNGTSGPRLESGLLDPLFLEQANTAEFAALARVATTRDNRVLVALPVGPQNDTVLEGWPQRVQRRNNGESVFPWMPHTLPISSLCIARVGTEDQIIGSSSDDPKVWRVFRSTNDDGVAIMADWWGRWAALIGDEPLERIRRVNVSYEGHVLVRTYIDLNMVSAEFSEGLVRPAREDPYWEGGTWVGGKWGAPPTIGMDTVRPEQHARYHSVRFSNNRMDVIMKVFAAELVYRGGKEHVEV